VAAEQNVDIVVREEFFSRPRWSLPFFSKRQKVLVEVGAARPDYLSIGASFREEGWKVIAIEPNPVFCGAHRSAGHEVLQYACSSEDKDDVDFFVVDSLSTEYMGGEVSHESFSSLGIRGDFEELHKTVAGKTTTSIIKVNVRKLDTILAQHEPRMQHIDILAIDVEGWELDVLKGLSIDRYKPKVVILENNFDDEAYRSYMFNAGYRLWKHLAPNEIYVRPS
jgi:FkbM family methyltransferase